MWSSEQTDKFTPEVREKPRRPTRCRLGTPEDVVPAILLLASDRASYITGQRCRCRAATMI
jgi:NAD(P)-dependent dehydrogenase (short-subunit alcohol dehydrogenase family)